MSILDPKPKKVKVKISRTVTEVAIVYLDRQGNVESVDEVLDTLDEEILDVGDIRHVYSLY